MLDLETLPSILDIRLAHERIAGFVHHTPIFTSDSLNTLTNARIFFKCENLQKTGSFKIRGAANALSLLSSQQLERGVATHSSGNHGAALAYAASLWGTNAYIVMPHNAPQVKKAAVQSYGAKIIECEPTLSSRQLELNKLVDNYNLCFIPPYNHPNIIAGQGTVAIELLENIQRLDYIIVPLGGGGLLSGTAISAASFAPQTKIIGVEPIGADDAYRSLKAGYIIPSPRPTSIADGLLTTVGSLTFSAIQKYVAHIIRVDDNAIKNAMGLIWERMKLIVEPSGAVALAAILTNTSLFDGKQIGVILSGGNIDFTNFNWQK